jgi:hypothetical protein
MVSVNAVTARHFPVRIAEKQESVDLLHFDYKR